MSKPADDRPLLLVNPGPLLEPLAAALAARGHRRFVVVGDRPLDLRDVEASVLLRAEHVGVPASEALSRTLGVAAAGAPLPDDARGWSALARGARFAVALVDTGPVLFHPWLEALNQAALATGRAWMVVSAHEGRELHVGPLFVPGETACHRCYELRTKSNVTALDEYLALEAHVRANGAVDFGVCASTAMIAAELAARDVARHLDGGAARTRSALVTLDLATLAVEEHYLLPVPCCAACEDATPTTLPEGSALAVPA